MDPVEISVGPLSASSGGGNNGPGVHYFRNEPGSVPKIMDPGPLFRVVPRQEVNDPGPFLK